MSILIKDISMPEDGEFLDLVITADGVVRAYDQEDKKITEAVELPDHGDLIDRDELIGEMKHLFGEETIVTFTMKMKGFKSTIKICPREPMFEQQCNLAEFVKISPVVIPAERE